MQMGEKGSGGKDQIDARLLLGPRHGQHHQQLLEEPRPRLHNHHAYSKRLNSAFWSPASTRRNMV